MKTGDLVTVYPHGHDELGWRGRVEICSRHQRALAIAFDKVPPFLDTHLGVMQHMKTGRIVLLLEREQINGKPGGPWVEIFGGAHYEVEES